MWGWGMWNRIELKMKKVKPVNCERLINRGAPTEFNGGLSLEVSDAVKLLFLFLSPSSPVDSPQTTDNRTSQTHRQVCIDPCGTGCRVAGKITSRCCWNL